jgi:hypothetical protein
MPVTPCFDPTTGASGGASGGGGGASLYNLPMTEVDLTDGSWTLLDPDGIVDTVSFSGGYNLVTFLAGGATSNQRWTGTTTCTAPRWYKSMQIDGNQVTLQDPTWFACRMQNDLTINDFDQQNVFTSSADPTSTNTNTIGATGGTWLRPVAGNTSYGVFSNNANTTFADVDTVFSHAAVMQGGGCNGAPNYIQYDAGNAAERQGSRNSNILNQAGTNRYIMVGVGINTDATVINAGDQVKFSLKYIALSFAGL